MKSFKPIASFVLMLVVGGFVGYGLGNSEIIESYLPSKDLFHWYQIIYFFLLYFLVIGIHELGHLLTGLALGYDFYLYVVGFLGIRREEDGSIKPYFNKDLGSFGGIAATFPKANQEFTADDFSKVVIAGPIVSLVLAVVCFAVAQMFAQPTEFFILYTGVISFFIFLATTVPSKTGIFYTDRKRYQRLKSTGKEKDIELAFLKASIYWISKKPISGMDIEELEKITTDDSAMFRHSGYYYLLSHIVESDRSRIPEVRAKMQELEKELPSTFVKMMEKEVAKLSLDEAEG